MLAEAQMEGGSRARLALQKERQVSKVADWTKWCESLQTYEPVRYYKDTTRQISNSTAIPRFWCQLGMTKAAQNALRPR